MNKHLNSQKINDRINIEISAESLAKAMASGNITASEIRGLDRNAKRSLWRLCLEACG